MKGARAPSAFPPETHGGDYLLVILLPLYLPNWKAVGTMIAASGFHYFLLTGSLIGTPKLFLSCLTNITERIPAELQIAISTKLVPANFWSIYE